MNPSSPRSIDDYLHALRAALASPPCISPIENQTGHALGMANRVGDGSRAALGDAEQRKGTFRGGGVASANA